MSILRPNHQYKFTLFLMDIENLMVGYWNDTNKREENPAMFLMRNAIQKICNYTDDYIVGWFCNDNLAKYQKDSKKEKWYLQSIQKMNPANKQLYPAGIDTMLVAVGIEYLLVYRNQIKEIFIGGSDCDYMPIYQKATELEIPVGMFAYSGVQLHNCYLSLPNLKHLFFLKTESVS